MKPIKTYNERRWVELRKTALKRDRYTDQYLKRYGKMRNAEIVHHIFPVNDFPEYQYELWNLISISKGTHNMFHDKYSNLLTDKGLEVLIRTARKNNIPIPEAYVKEVKLQREIYEEREMERKNHFRV